MVHDPVVAETVRSADHLEPRFVIDAQEQAAAVRLAAFRGASGKRPNVLVILFDDVGLGRLRLLRRWCRGRRADPEHRQARAPRAAAHELLLGAVVHAVAGVADDRPAADAPRPAAAADVRPARRARRRDHGRAAPARRGLRHPSRRQVAHGREPRVATAARRLRRLLRIPLRLRHVHRVAGPELLPRDRLQRGADPLGREPAVQQVLRPRHARWRDAENVEEVTIPVLSTLDDKWADYSLDFIRRIGAAEDAPWFLYHCTRGAHFDNYPHRTVPRELAGEAPVQGHDHRARRHRRSARRGARGDRPARGHAHLPLLRQRTRDGDVARRRVLAVPQREGLHVGGRPACAGHRRVAGDDRSGPGERRAVLADGPVQHDPAARRRRRPHPERPLHRRRRPDVVPARRRAASPTASTSTTGW